MKKSLLLFSSVMLLACSSTFSQQEEKKAHVQKQVKTEATTPTKKEKVESSEAVKLKKQVVKKEAVELKTVNRKATSVREERIED